MVVMVVRFVRVVRVIRVRVRLSVRVHYSLPS